MQQLNSDERSDNNVAKGNTKHGGVYYRDLPLPGTKIVDDYKLSKLTIASEPGDFKFLRIEIKSKTGATCNVSYNSWPNSLDANTIIPGISLLSKPVFERSAQIYYEAGGTCPVALADRVLAGRELLEDIYLALHR